MDWAKTNSIFIIIPIIYLVGILGLIHPIYKEQFLQLTPLNLLLTFAVLVWKNKNFRPSFLILLLLIFFIGYFVEIAGVSTGILFGEYDYGPVLGFKLFDVPLMIGINWIILSLSSYGIVSSFVQNRFFIVLFSSLLMTFLDVLIEPVAMHFNFWSWENDVIPMQNFIMWFIVSVCIQLLMVFFKTKINRNISYLVFGIQLLFFSILNLLT